MTDLLSLVKAIGPFAGDDLQAIENVGKLAKRVVLKKGTNLFEEGQLVDFFAFVNQGFLRHYVFDSNHNEKIIQFYKEGDFVWDSQSFVNKEKVGYSVQAIEDAQVLIIGYDELYREMGHLPCFMQIGARIMGWAAENHQEHLMMVMKYTPLDRYHYLLENKPEYIRRISVTHLAQFLNLTRETVSRLRAKAVDNNL